MADIVRAYRPNAMNWFETMEVYLSRLLEFLTDDPRESYTEGGLLPAIYGTAMMVLLMSVIVTPLGVLAGVYLSEYAPKGWLTRAIRISVNNLAGVPSIVYGMFGLGFFIYLAGGEIDRLFYSESLPAPTFGTPGLLWASLTLALLTLPVVIVATEEGLANIPASLREGSLALGATKFETLWRIILPLARPSMLTGLILAVARAAGEIAPTMLVGVVKLAPSLPLDTEFPYLHLEQQFMHLGYYVYDLAMQSPNVEAAMSQTFAAAFLLVAVVTALNLSAVVLRGRLRERYRHGYGILIMNEAPEHLNAPATGAVEPAPCLEVRNLTVHYAGHPNALDKVRLTVPRQRVTALIGPSGCGKTSLLRCFNRLNDLVDDCVITGRIKLEGKNIYSSKIDVTELRRRVGMVFQKPNPFPKSIYENVAFGLRIRGINSRRRLDEIVQESLNAAALWARSGPPPPETRWNFGGQRTLVIARRWREARGIVAR